MKYSNEENKLTSPDTVAEDDDDKFAATSLTESGAWLTNALEADSALLTSLYFSPTPVMLDAAFKPLFAGRKRTTTLSNVDVELAIELTDLDALPDAVIPETEVSCAEPSILSKTFGKTVNALLDVKRACARRFKVVVADRLEDALEFDCPFLVTFAIAYALEFAFKLAATLRDIKDAESVEP